MVGRTVSHYRIVSHLGGGASATAARTVSGALLTHRVAHRRSRAWLVIAATALLTVAVVSTALLLRRRPERTPGQLIPIRLTNNSPENLVIRMALSPDGKYLAYSDTNGVHVRSIQTADSRLLPDTKGMWVQYWAADATQFFTAKWTGGQFVFYSVSLPGGVPRPIGDAVPSPGGHYSETFSLNHAEIRAAGRKVYSLDRKDARGGWKAWSPHDKRYAVVFNTSASALSDRIEILEPESGRWTTVASSREEITGIVWRSDHELLYAKSEPTPRTDSNLWVVDLNPETGGPSDFPRRLTQWTNYSITQLSASADGSRLCFRTQDRRPDIYRHPSVARKPTRRAASVDIGGGL